MFASAMIKCEPETGDVEEDIPHTGQGDSSPYGSEMRGVATVKTEPGTSTEQQYIKESDTQSYPEIYIIYPDTKEESLETSRNDEDTTESLPLSPERVDLPSYSAGPLLGCEYNTPKKKTRPKRVFGPFECLQCSFVSIRKRNLMSHMLTHTGEKPFACSLCSYTCSMKSNLKKHMMTHTGERPFSCSQCSFTCPFQYRLKQHMVTHTGEKPFSCSVCSFTCSKKSNLSSHMVIHSGKKSFSCSQCSFTCLRGSALKRHLLVHTTEKPFSCSQCSFTSNQKSNLNRHTLIHAGEKSFSYS